MTPSEAQTSPVAPSPKSDSDRHSANDDGRPLMSPEAELGHFLLLSHTHKKPDCWCLTSWILTPIGSSVFFFCVTPNQIKGDCFSTSRLRRIFTPIFAFIGRFWSASSSLKTQMQMSCVDLIQDLLPGLFDAQEGAVPPTIRPLCLNSQVSSFGLGSV